VAYVVRPKADRDIDDISDDLADRANLDVALRFLALVYETFALIATQTEMGWLCKLNHPELANTRVFRVREPFNQYLIYYSNPDGQIEILRVLHGAQDINTRISSERVT
jgi:toxin ParE1/3/4